MKAGVSFMGHYCSAKWCVSWCHRLQYRQLTVRFIHHHCIQSKYFVMIKIKFLTFIQLRANAATISAFSSRVSQLIKLNSEQLRARINVTRVEDGGSGSGSGFTVRLLPISWLFRETLSHTLSHLHQQISIPRPQEEIGLECPITQQMLT